MTFFCDQFSSMDFIALVVLDSQVKAKMLSLVECGLSYWSLPYATTHLIVYYSEVFICPYIDILDSKYFF